MVHHRNRSLHISYLVRPSQGSCSYGNGDRYLTVVGLTWTNPSTRTVIISWISRNESTLFPTCLVMGFFKVAADVNFISAI